MTITTYTELKAAIADWLLRDDLTAVIPSFISLAEADISRKMRHWQQEKKVRTSVDEGFEFLPDDWLATISLRHADGVEIKQVGVTEMADLKDLPRSGRPAFYRLEAGRIEFYPVPDRGYDVDLVYFGRIPSLSDAATTNWLLTNHPDIMLYGSLVQAAPYLDDDQKLSVWSSLYNSALQSIQADSNSARHSGPLRMRVKIQ
jgi:hypothetical protein